MKNIRLIDCFLTFAIAVFALGNMNPSFAGKKCNEDPNHPSCPGDDNTSDVKLFDVFITGEDVGGDGYDWIQDSGQSQVSYKEFWDDDSSGRLIHLDYFQSLWNGAGATCFPDEIFFPDNIHAALIKKAKKGSAKALIWFWGYTTLGVPGGLVPYQLGLTGSFASGGFPPAPEKTSTIDMHHWKMGLANQGQDIKAISCIGEKPDGENFSVDITVTGN
jgi:hypothetical protein